MKLSIIIPCFNEDKTIEVIFNKVNEFNTLEKEIIIKARKVNIFFGSIMFY